MSLSPPMLPSFLSSLPSAQWESFLWSLILLNGIVGAPTSVVSFVLFGPLKLQLFQWKHGNPLISVQNFLEFDSCFFVQSVQEGMVLKGLSHLLQALGVKLQLKWMPFTISSATRACCDGHKQECSTRPALMVKGTPSMWRSLVQ